MNKWERCTDNKHCRELSYNGSPHWIFLVFVKETKKLEVSFENSKQRLLPRVSKKDMEWLING